MSSWLITRTDVGQASILVHDAADVRVYLMAKVEAHKPRLDQSEFLAWADLASRPPQPYGVTQFGPMPNGAVYQVRRLGSS